MPLIMATRELWREIGDGAPLANRSDVPRDSTKLGAWSAKCVHLPEGDFCIAVNETTYLTIAFPLVPLPEFLVAFSYALGSQLEQLGVPGPAAVAEVRPFLAGTAFAKNSNRSLLGTLNDLEYHFALAMEGARTSSLNVLTEAQRHLNAIPHGNRSVPFPADAAVLLFRPSGSA
jgi:hypothetical protein